MYKPVKLWFKKYIKSKVKNAIVKVFDAHDYYVSHIIEKINAERYFPEYLAFKIKTDVLGVIIKDKKGYLGVIECKTKPITVMDLSQAIGYSRILQPALSLIVSPSGWSEAIHSLIEIYKREDVLNYHEKKKLIIATWDNTTASVLYERSLPKGHLASFSFSI